jgi:hypothetical protein
MLKTRYSGGQIKWGHLIMTTCCGGLKPRISYSGVPGIANPYSGVIVVTAYIVSIGAIDQGPNRMCYAVRMSLRYAQEHI